MNDGPSTAPPERRAFVVVNADDFGQSDRVNAGVAAAHEHGLVTSASLMVRYPAARSATEWARRHPRLGLGLHLDLGEWVLDGGAWRALYEVVPATDAVAVEREVAAQIARFEDLVGAPPDHLDSHQHVHLREPVRAIVSRHAARLGVPLRSHGPVAYCGRFYGQDEHGASHPEWISPSALAGLVDEIAATPSPGSRAVEIACHPSRGADPDTMYRSERELELRALCSPEARVAVARSGVILCRFSDLPPGLRSAAVTVEGEGGAVMRGGA